MSGVDPDVPMALQDRTKKIAPGILPPATVIDSCSVEAITHDGLGHGRLGTYTSMII